MTVRKRDHFTFQRFAYKTNAFLRFLTWSRFGTAGQGHDFATFSFFCFLGARTEFQLALLFFWLLTISFSSVMNSFLMFRHFDFATTSQLFGRRDFQNRAIEIVSRKKKQDELVSNFQNKKNPRKRHREHCLSWYRTLKIKKKSRGCSKIICPRYPMETLATARL